MSRPAQRWDEWNDTFDEPELEDEAAARSAPARSLPAPWPTPSRAPGVAPRHRVRWGQLATVTVVAYLVVMGATSELTLLGVTRQANALGAQAAALTAANQGLRHQVTLLHQRRYVDELARTELGYVSPGEVELVPTQTTRQAGAARRS